MSQKSRPVPRGVLLMLKHPPSPPIKIFNINELNLKHICEIIEIKHICEINKNKKIIYFCFIRLNFVIEMAKIPNFSCLRRLLAPEANIFVQILVNFDKKSTKIFIFFVKNDKFSRTPSARESRYSSSEKEKVVKFY